MDDFDLLGPLVASAAAARDGGKAEKAHADLARETLARRAERNKPFVRRHQQFASGYVSSAALIAAANVALSLGRPLLLTGEPGSGKTLTAYWLAHVLGLGHVLEFHVKSESRAQDLLYTFDAVSWYRRSQAAAVRGEKGSVSKKEDLYPGPLGKAFGWAGAPAQPHLVLIDEIDKAPRDFPNDLLLELDQMRFSIPEASNREVKCPEDKRPIVVITSNQERRLPDPFLRRCVLHEINLDDNTVVNILKARLSDFSTVAPPAEGSDAQAIAEAEAKLMSAALSFWKRVKDTKNLSRTYTIDEFWRWLALATRERASAAGMTEIAEALQASRLRDGVLRGGTLFSEGDLRALGAGAS